MTETKVEIIGEEEKSTIFIGNEEGIILYKEELRKYYQVKHGDIVFESTKDPITILRNRYSKEINIEKEIKNEEDFKWETISKEDMEWAYTYAGDKLEFLEITNIEHKKIVIIDSTKYIELFKGFKITITIVYNNVVSKETITYGHNRHNWKDKYKQTINELHRKNKLKSSIAIKLKGTYSINLDNKSSKQIIIKFLQNLINGKSKIGDKINNFNLTIEEKGKWYINRYYDDRLDTVIDKLIVDKGIIVNTLDKGNHYENSTSISNILLSSDKYENTYIEVLESNIVDSNDILHIKIIGLLNNKLVEGTSDCKFSSLFNNIIITKSNNKIDDIDIENLLIKDLIFI